MTTEGGNALELRNLDATYRVRGCDRQVFAGVSCTIPALRVLRPRWRVRLQQVNDRARSGRVPAAQRPVRDGSIELGAICGTEEPPLAEAENGHLLRCHIPIEQLVSSSWLAGAPTSKEHA